MEEILKTKKFQDLTPEELQYLKSKDFINSFGPSGNVFFRILLDFIARKFNICDARAHDFEYWKGGTEIERIKADCNFLKFMLIDCEKIGTRYRLVAYTYFIAVRLFGKYYFNFDKK